MFSSIGTTPVVFDDREITLAVGDALRLVCPIQSWSPSIAVNWYKDAKAIDAVTDRYAICSGSGR